MVGRATNTLPILLHYLNFMRIRSLADTCLYVGFSSVYPTYAPLPSRSNGRLLIDADRESKALDPPPNVMLVR